MLLTFRCKVRELKADESNWEMLINKLYQQRATCSDKTLADWTIDRFKKHLETTQRQLKRFLWLVQLAQGKVQKEELNIEGAKEYLIGDIIPTEKKNSSGGRDYYLCCLHTERSPSLVVYKNNNTWHCFGCGEGNDSIDMVMKMNDMSFIDAVKQLT